MNVLVIGSINQDIVVNTARVPEAGETVLGQSLHYFPGGKGANQAVAAARLGAKVAFIGAVGTDDAGKSLCAQLAAEGIDISGVRTLPDYPTGTAHITVCAGENRIIVLSGANFALLPEDIARCETYFAAADVILTQLEIPLPCVRTAAQMAQQYGKPFILNPAPAMTLPDELINACTLLTPNESEYARLFPLSSDNASQQPQNKVLLTCGANGVYYRDQGQVHHQAIFPVKVVDTTGAGDTFNGALAAFWGQGLPEAVRRASAAAALSVTHAGAQSGMPTQDELNAFLQQNE